MVLLSVTRSMHVYYHHHHYYYYLHVVSILVLKIDNVLLECTWLDCIVEIVRPDIIYNASNLVKWHPATIILFCCLPWLVHTTNSPRAKRIPIFFPSNSCNGALPMLGNAWWMFSGTVMMRYVKKSDRRKRFWNQAIPHFVRPGTRNTWNKLYLQKYQWYVVYPWVDSIQSLAIPSWFGYVQQEDRHCQ